VHAEHRNAFHQRTIRQPEINIHILLYFHQYFMTNYRGLTFGVLFVLLAIVLMSAGCTQPSGGGTSTTTPTPTAATLPATVTANPQVTTNTTTNVTVNVTALKAELPVLARKFADQIDGKTLEAAANEGPNSTAFTTVLSQLKAFKASDSRLIYVYTLEQQNGTVRFIVDANYGLPGGSGFREEYPDAPAVLKSPVTKPLAAGPYTDSYGTFVSGYAPVNTSSNQTTFVLAIDVKA
jgi:hypothetical protein